MAAIDMQRTGIFIRQPCTDCRGSGEHRIDSENINENFEVEKQTVLTPCPRCNGSGFVNPSEESTIPGNLH
jgi:DnaJ-class molecular chaperone